ncbi:MAG: NADH-quinone oxidoreductase subunit NuoE, partial [Candidatus Hydrogenedentes bacterium]|nr:NADH-quinone oxidoreductase subunit NuoE [Candidatus Hydrogenedentota bacterium]
MPEVLDIDDIDQIVAENGRRPDAVIPILQAIQTRYQYLPDAALERVCALTEITPASIEGVATFYSQFRRTPAGRHIISLCDGTACHVKGALGVYDAIVRKLRLSPGEDTDAEGLFTLQRVACLGCCTRAPAIQIDDVTYGHVRPDAVPNIIKSFLEHDTNGKRHPRERKTDLDWAAGEIRVGLGSCCVAGGSEKVRQALEEALAFIESDVRVKHVSCVGMCHRTPLLEVVLPGSPAQLYANVQAQDVPGIVTRHFKPRNSVLRLRASFARWLDGLYSDDDRGVVERHAIDVRDEPVAAFLGKQRRLATEHCGELAPTDLDEYRRRGGFEALRKCLPASKTAPATHADLEAQLRPDQITPEQVRPEQVRPEQITEVILRSGLRGRGGAGFPTGIKWKAVHEAAGDPKYIICNGDEGDPGAFMDRMILESYPYRVIEGMLIASIAVGAEKGLFYIRAEYPLAVRRVEEAIRLCEEAGYLGDDILGSGHSLHLHVMKAAGAFVCGEETALMASVEGRRGFPSHRPPYPAQSGLYGCPTLINNTETFSLVPWIVRNGADAFAAFGTEKSKGTKVFSLAGKIKNGGLIEVPMGITIREIIDDIGGGIEGGGAFKAVLVGGPSGGCIPASLGHTRVDYEALSEVGAMMGSGGMVVLDDSDCIVEIARYFLSFTQLESCGKCAPCRIGTKRMLEMLTRLTEGKGKESDLELLEELAHVVKDQSLCGLGKTAPNPVLTSLKYFREEFDAHVQGKCPAGK